VGRKETHKRFLEGSVLGAEIPRGEPPARGGHFFTIPQAGKFTQTTIQGKSPFPRFRKKEGALSLGLGRGIGTLQHDCRSTKFDEKIGFIQTLIGVNKWGVLHRLEFTPQPGTTTVGTGGNVP